MVKSFTHQIQKYPKGIKYDTSAFLVDVEIPKDTQTIELKSYSGKHTWADELVLGGAMLWQW